LPLGFIALRNTHGQDALALAGAAAALTFMANQVAGSLAWITISAEEAPEVLASAPAPISLIRRAKMAAVILVVSGLLAPVLLPLIVLAPLAGLAASAGCAAAMLSAVLLNTWWQRPAKRSEFRNRRNTSWFVTVAELGLGLLIGGATGLFAAGQPWGLFPAFLAAGTLLALRRDEPHIELDLRSA
jgi:ABC-2 type transport system permease protein